MSEPDWSLPMNRTELIARCEALAPSANARLEVIQWHAVTEQLPDADTTVFVSSPDANEPVWLGYFDTQDQVWCDVSGFELVHAVVAWADLPRGPA